MAILESYPTGRRPGNDADPPCTTEIRPPRPGEDLKRRKEQAAAAHPLPQAPSVLDAEVGDLVAGQRPLDVHS
ncbi:MAG: hypothetical protein NTV92_09185, partial [Candidatus Bipolaricaulota bacterium]|nr:hypothetical protein [Candidatus Bipolaricaulota bacterium]